MREGIPVGVLQNAKRNGFGGSDSSILVPNEHTLSQKIRLAKDTQYKTYACKFHRSLN